MVVEAYWDDEARVWVASAVGDIGLVTEAPTIGLCRIGSHWFCLTSSKASTRVPMRSN